MSLCVALEGVICCTRRPSGLVVFLTCTPASAEVVCLALVKAGFFYPGVRGGKREHVSV